MIRERGNEVLHGKEGSFALLEIIGKGAYGTVYKGIWRELGKHVAIKRVLRSRLTEDEKKALQDEIYLFKNLKHDHIVNYIEAIEATEEKDDKESNYLDIVLEYVEGGSLFNMVDSIRKTQVDEQQHVLIFEEVLISNFIKQILLGLQYLHYQGVIHRDIKAANLLITKDRHIKLTDFGVSSTSSLKSNAEDTPPQQQQPAFDIAGSPYWMAPEIIKLTGSSTASDIWSLGCTLIELLTGLPPYHQYEDITALFKIVSDDCPPLPPNISGECEDFLRKCFNKDVQARATADELLQHKWIINNNKSNKVDNNSSLNKNSSVNGFENEFAFNESVSNNNDSAIKLDQYEEDDDDDDFDDLDFEVSEFGSSSNNNENGRNSLSNENINISTVSSSSFTENNQSSPSFNSEDQIIDVSKGMRSTSLREDPFQDLMEDPEVDQERERLRKEKELWQIVKQQVSLLGKDADIHVESCDILIEIFKNNPEQRYNLIYDPGLLPIIEILENFKDNQKIIEGMLKVTLSFLENDNFNEIENNNNNNTSSSIGYMSRKSNIREDLCLAGILPIVMEYCSRKYCYNVRLLSGKFLKEMIELDKILYMFVSCGGFSIFVDLLEDDILKYEKLCNIAIFGIYKLFGMNNHKHKRDFCRKFVWNGLLDKIIDNLLNSIREINKKGVSAGNLRLLQNTINELCNLLKIFAARSDSIVKTKMISKTVLNLFNEIIINKNNKILNDSIQSILCGIRDLSRDPQTHESLQNYKTINTLVEYLILQNNTININIKHFIISSLHNLCIVSTIRQESIVLLGIIPYLQKIILSKDMNLKSLCIDLYSGLACASHLTRSELGKYNGIDFYIELMVLLCQPGTVRRWQVRVLQSIYEWLEDNELQKYVESRLSIDDNKQKFCDALIQIKLSEIEGILEPYLKIITVSSITNVMFGCSHELIVAMIRWLDEMYNTNNSNNNYCGPRGRLLLLRTLLAHAKLWKAGALPRGTISELRVLLTDMILVLEEAIIVKEQAALLLSIIDSIS